MSGAVTSRVDVQRGVVQALVRGKLEHGGHPIYDCKFLVSEFALLPSPGVCFAAGCSVIA